MRIGLYTFASLALIGLAAAFAYTINPSNFAYEIAGINLNFPIALWISIPMLVLLIMTIFHMMYHGTKSFFARRKWVRDANELQDALYWALLKEPKKHTFAMSEMKSGAALLSVSSLDALDSTEGLSDKLGQTINWVKKIQDGEYVDLKEKKVAKFLSKDNPLVVQNTLNRLSMEPEFAESILIAADEHPQEVSSKALNTLVGTATIYKLSKFIKMIDSSHIKTLLDRAQNGEDIGLTVENIEFLANNVDLRCSNFIEIAKTAIKVLSPDETLKVFKKISSEHSKAENAYLYLLFQYEMLDDAKAYLEESEEDEFKPFRALLVLKKGKYKYRLSELISSSNACNEN